MSCDPERVTAFVDGELDPLATAVVAAHLEACTVCRSQMEAERRLRAELKALGSPALPVGFEARVRARCRRRPVGAAVRWALPLAAMLVAGFWLRGHAPFVAWDLSRDHRHCFTKRPLPAQVRSGEARTVREWFENQGTYLPEVPEGVGDLALVGARYCPLVSLTLAPHVYYASSDRGVSVFVVPQHVRLADRFAGTSGGSAVRLVRVEGELVGIVGESEAEVRAFETALRPVLAKWAASRRESPPADDGG